MINKIIIIIIYLIAHKIKFSRRHEFSQFGAALALLGLLQHHIPLPALHLCVFPVSPKLSPWRQNGAYKGL
jgi:hypothetical protein